MSDPIADRKMTDEQNIAQLLRQWAEVINLPSGPFVKEDLIYAADTIAKLAEDVDCYKTSFDAAWEADMRGVKMWREAHPGNDLVLPDRANFTAWILAEIVVQRADNEKLRAVLEKAEGGFYNMANAIDDYDYHGPAPQCTGDIIGHREQFHRVHVEQLVKYAEECRAALSGDKHE